MPNCFATKPELPILTSESVWECPITGLTVPKGQHANLQWRADLLEAAADDEGLQVDLYTACSQSLLFFVNAFAFTLRVFESDQGRNTQAQNQHLPYITWPVQDRHLLRLEHAIDSGEDLLTDKSRDMGATWDHIVTLVHKFIFEEQRSFLILSNKEDNVDQLSERGKSADPSTLMGKIDYLLNFLPEWLKPNTARKKMHIVNSDNGSRIDGESANANAGTSGRRTAILLDEMAKMEQGESIKRSTRDVSVCRLPCSTPNGAGTAYSKWRMSGKIPVFILPWWEHPEKGAGSYTEQDELGRWKIRSPWYDFESSIRSPKEMAIEVDMDHIGSGDKFFEEHFIESHRQQFAAPPKRTFGLSFRKEVPDSDIPAMLARRDRRKVCMFPSGPWKLWGKLDKGRPDQSKSYTIGVDIGKGQGASNSTIHIGCNETKEKIAAFACANTPPYELAKLACLACLWCGGRVRPLLIWENNGDPGFDFGRSVVRVYKYPRVYYDRAAGTSGERVGKRFGWRSNREKKAAGLGQLRRAYAHGGFINHCEDSLNEALSYVGYDSGGIGPAELVEESDSARQCHGDRVIADMLLVIGMSLTPAGKVKKAGPPEASAKWRMQQWKAKKNSKLKTRSFDYSGE